MPVSKLKFWFVGSTRRNGSVDQFSIKALRTKDGSALFEESFDEATFAQLQKPVPRP